MSSPLKHEKTDTSFWDQRRGLIQTKIGGMVIGEAVYSHGYDMMEDLVGKASYFQVLVLNATGRLPERRLADWLEALFIGNSYPDSRIWCNQIGSLGGTMQSSPVAATCAGVLAADSSMYGSGVMPPAVDFFVDALEQHQKGESVEEIVMRHAVYPNLEKPVILGFARPVVSGDERVIALERLRRQLGFDMGAFLQLAFDIEKIMMVKADEKMNLLGYLAPFLLDQGLCGRDIYNICSMAVASGVLACYAEAANQAPESYFPLQCKDIEYRGASPRTVPKK